MIYAVKSNSELYHHGILGMKWGKRNGPPYPLGSGDHSASERKAGWRKSLGAESKSSNYYKKRMAGGSAVNAANKRSTNRPSKNGNAKNIDKSTGFHKIESKETQEQRLERINPNYKESRYVTPYNRNCGNTVIANELRCRGLDVEARGNNYGLTLTNMEQFFDGISETKTEIMPKARKLKSSTVNGLLLFGKTLQDPKIHADVESRGKEIREQYAKSIKKSYPDGSRGAMMLAGLYGSHWISWEIKDGNVEFQNPQDPSHDLNMDFGTHNYVKGGPKPTALRLDNLSINNKNISDVVMDYNSDADKNGMSFNPLITAGFDFTKTKPEVLEAQVNRYFGPKWDGSWEAFDSIQNMTIKELESREEKKK